MTPIKANLNNLYSALSRPVKVHALCVCSSSIIHIFEFVLLKTLVVRVRGRSRSAPISLLFYSILFVYQSPKLAERRISSPDGLLILQVPKDQRNLLGRRASSPEQQEQIIMSGKERNEDVELMAESSFVNQKKPRISAIPADGRAEIIGGKSAETYFYRLFQYRPQL